MTLLYILTFTVCPQDWGAEGWGVWEGEFHLVLPRLSQQFYWLIVFLCSCSTLDRSHDVTWLSTGYYSPFLLLLHRLFSSWIESPSQQLPTEANTSRYTVPSLSAETNRMSFWLSMCLQILEFLLLLSECLFSLLELLFVHLLEVIYGESDIQQ